MRAKTFSMHQYFLYPSVIPFHAAFTLLVDTNCAFPVLSSGSNNLCIGCLLAALVYNMLP